MGRNDFRVECLISKEIDGNMSELIFLFSVLIKCMVYKELDVLMFDVWDHTGRQ